MNQKILKIGAAFPVVAAGLLSYAGSASAADFSQGGQLNIATALQLDVSSPSVETGEGGGGDNIFADILFAPTLPEGFTIGNFTGAMDDMVSADNRILDVDTNEDSVFDRDTRLGDFGEVVATAGNTGAFAEVATGTMGQVINFEADRTGADIPNFLTVGDFVISLDASTIETSLDESGVFEMELQSPGTDAEVTFSALGTANSISQGTSAPARFDFTAQFLFDNGDGGDPVALDDITGIGSVSGSVIVGGQDIPEPSSILGMLVLGGGFLSQGLLRKKVAPKS